MNDDAVASLRALIAAANQSLTVLDAGAAHGWDVGGLDEGLAMFIADAEDRIGEIMHRQSRASEEEGHRRGIRNLSDLEGGAT